MAQIIKFDPQQEVDIYEMIPEQLREYQSTLLEELAALDAREPKNMTSESYDTWANEHEELEDLLDEIQDLLDEQDP